MGSTARVILSVIPTDVRRSVDFELSDWLEPHSYKENVSIGSNITYPLQGHQSGLRGMVDTEGNELSMSNRGIIKFSFTFCTPVNKLYPENWSHNCRDAQCTMED